MMHIWFWLSVAALAIGITITALTQSWSSRDELLSEDEKTSTNPFDRLVLLRKLAESPFRVLTAAMAVAIYLVLFPIVVAGVPHWTNAIFATLYVTLQTFAAGADVGGELTTFANASDWLTRVQALYSVVLFTLAPLMAVGFVLTFFASVTARLRYWWHRSDEANIFSELNERSLLLAESIRRENRGNKRRDVIVFTGVDANTPTELVGQARRLGAISFKTDILSLPLYQHSRASVIRFFIMSPDESRNITQALNLIEHPVYSVREKTDLFVFSDDVQAELALRHHGGKVHVRRVNLARTLVYDWLWRGTDLFTKAAPIGNDREISAAVVGLDATGLEMVRALAWYCQMDTDDVTYRLRVNAFDADPLAAERFQAAYPELAKLHDGPSRSSGKKRQDAIYDIKVVPGINATNPNIVQHLLDIDPLTFVFISLGDDSTNLNVATEIRRAFARSGRDPSILTIAQHSDTIRRTLDNETAYMKDAAGIPKIELIGDFADVYSFGAIIRSAMEWNGLVCHMGWAGREQKTWQEAIEFFWEDEYPYSSSIAVPIAWRARRALDVPGARRLPEARNDDQKNLLKRLEHARWNAFMRSEGFVYGPKKETVIAKTHPLLVEYDRLDPSTQDKDDNDSRDILLRLEAELAVKQEALKSGQGDPAFVAELRDFIQTAGPLVDPSRAWECQPQPGG